jgi:hypothetical protein
MNGIKVLDEVQLALLKARKTKLRVQIGAAAANIDPQY